MKLSEIKINHIFEPLGFMLFDTPVVSFKVQEALGSSLECVKLSVSSDNRLVFDSGLIKEELTAYPLEVRLAPRTKYDVLIEAFSDAGEAASARTWFETGKMDEPWRAEWITTAHNDDNSVPQICKSFNLNKEIERARLYVGCAGLYELNLNGERVGNEHLTPYCNSYSNWMQVITHDLTEQLKQGENLLEATLAEGWYKGRFGLEGRKNIYGDTLALIAELHIVYSDGSEELIITDESWFSRKSVYKRAEIYNGVELDFKRTFEKKYPVSVLNLEKSKLTDRLSPPVAVKQTLPVAEVFTTPKGEKCLDMGQNMVGRLSIDTKAFPDKDFSIRFFEVLSPEGNVYLDNLRSAKQGFVYKTDGKARVVEPEFTFYGFRYACVEGLDALPKGAFSGQVLYSDLEQTGKIETSNALVNRLFLNALWGQKCNFVDVPTDCPQRDERLGWTGDAQVFCGTANFNMDSAAFFAKYMFDLWQEQQSRGGGVPHFVPSFMDGNDKSVNASSAAWGDAAAIVPWSCYLHSGDKSMLSRQYPGMKAWVEYIRKMDRGNHLWDTDFHFGDWLALDTPRPHLPPGTTPNVMVASAYYLYSTTLLSKASAVLGRTAEAKEYNELADNILKAIQNEFVTPSGRIASDTQTANVIALFMDFATDREKAAKMLNEKILNNDGHLNTGFVGTAYLCRVLSDNGYNDTAYKLLLNRDYPGWLYEVEKGATTIWERWDSIKPDGSLGDVSMNSFNHYAYGAVMEWMYRNVAGLKPLEDSAGFRKIRLSPQPNPRLEWFKSEYNSACGTYRSEWKISESGLSFTFEIPFGGEAELFLPDAPTEIIVNGQKTEHKEGMKLKKGVYRIEYAPSSEYYPVFSLDSPANDVFERKDLMAWLRENVPEFNNLMFFVFLTPFEGSLRSFLESHDIVLDKETSRKLNDHWKNIRSWD